MTAQEAARRQREPPRETVALDRLAGVDGARGLEAAGAGQERREEALVQAEQPDRDARAERHGRGSRASARVTADAKSSESSRKVDAAAYGYFVYFQLSRDAGPNLMPIAASVSYRLP